MVQRHLQYREAELGAAGRGGERASKASTPSSSESQASRKVSSMTAPSCPGSRLSGNRKLPNFIIAPAPSRIRLRLADTSAQAS
jgi:hypothetical protein